VEDMLWRKGTCAQDIFH